MRLPTRVRVIIADGKLGIVGRCQEVTALFLHQPQDARVAGDQFWIEVTDNLIYDYFRVARTCARSRNVASVSYPSTCRRSTMSVRPRIIAAPSPPTSCAILPAPAGDLLKAIRWSEHFRGANDYVR
jgi:hypothetical protein